MVRDLLVMQNSQQLLVEVCVCIEDQFIVVICVVEAYV